MAKERERTRLRNADSGARRCGTNATACQERWHWSCGSAGGGGGGGRCGRRVDTLVLVLVVASVSVALAGAVDHPTHKRHHVSIRSSLNYASSRSKDSEAGEDGVAHTRHRRVLKDAPLHWDVYRFDIADDTTLPRAQCEAGCMTRTVSVWVWVFKLGRIIFYMYNVVTLTCVMTLFSFEHGA